MSILLPSRITRYRVSEVSPTEELMVLGHIYAQVGDYASSILDREHHAIAKDVLLSLEYSCAGID